VTSSTIANCTADNPGGAIYSSGTVTVTSSTIANCTAAPVGGAIDANTVNITSSTITGCSAPEAGSAIYSETGNINFDRIFDNTGSVPVVNPGEEKTGSTPVVGAEGILNATYNWWGTNADPEAYVQDAAYQPWLVLGITVSPTSITTAQTSAIVANLTFNSAGSDTSTGGVFVLNGIPVSFTVVSGPGSVNPLTETTTNGISQTTFSSGTAGTAVINATVDDQSVSAIVTITQAPTPTPSGSGPHSAGTCYWCSGSGSSGTTSGYTGPSTTPAAGSPTQMPTVGQPTQMVTQQPTVNLPATISTTIPPVPTNTPKSGFDTIPVIGALGLCGVIVLFRKNGN
jgi:hypothetical protein